jgi:hypothetical protein
VFERKKDRDRTNKNKELLRKIDTNKEEIQGRQVSERKAKDKIVSEWEKRGREREITGTNWKESGKDI